MPNAEEIAYKYISSLGSHFQQLKAAINNKTQPCPKTLVEAQEMADGFMPLQALSKSNSSASFATKAGGGTSSNPGSTSGSGATSNNITRVSSATSNNNGEAKFDCNICKSYFKGTANKKHFAADCPNIKSCLPTGEVNSNVTSQSSHNITVESIPNLRLSRAGIGFAITAVASISTALKAFVYEFEYHQPHKNYEILDPQSQVSIFNNLTLVTNIRKSGDTLTLHGMGLGSLLVDQIADHHILGTV